MFETWHHANEYVVGELDQEVHKKYDNVRPNMYLDQIVIEEAVKVYQMANEVGKRASGVGNHDATLRLTNWQTVDT